MNTKYIRALVNEGKLLSEQDDDMPYRIRHIFRELSDELKEY